MDLDILFPAALNGLTMGAIYALIALGLTLIYGVLHIINFAHGSLMMAALYGVYFGHALFGLDPYLALLVVPPLMFLAGYGLQRFVINWASGGKDENLLLVTLGISVVIDNLALVFFRSDTRTIDSPYAGIIVEFGSVIISLPRLIALAGAIVLGLLLWAFMTRTDTGLAIRAVARERHGASLAGINVRHVFAVSFGIGCACLGVAACLLMPGHFVNPTVGIGFVLIAFTVVVLGGMGSFVGALIGGLLVGLVEGLAGFYFEESLGQLAIFVVFIAVLLVRPNGLFGKGA